MEQTLILIKPDAMQRGLAFEILSRLENRGLRLAGLRLLQVEQSMAEKHYAEHEGKPFFAGLVSYITSSPIIAAVFEGTNAVSAARQSIGSTNPTEASPGTIRGDFGLEINNSHLITKKTTMASVIHAALKKIKNCGYIYEPRTPINEIIFLVVSIT